MLLFAVLHDVQSLPSLFVGVLSAPMYFDRREAVRNTWMPSVVASCNRAGIETTAKFIIGDVADRALEQQILEEHNAHSDIERVPNVVESYALLSRKTVALMNVANADFVMKADDDIYLHAERFCKDLKGLVTTQEHYWGFFHNKSFVVRLEGVKFSEPSQNDCQHHLPYASGCGYVVTRNLARYIAAPPVPLREFRNEDVAGVVWCVHATDCIDID
jgi:hypothetical protein